MVTIPIYQFSNILSKKLEKKIWGQDLVFSVKLQFGKTMVSVQNKFALQKIKVRRKIFASKTFGSKKLKSMKKNLLRIFRSCQIWVHRIFGSKISFGLKKFLGLKIFWLNTVLGSSKKFWSGKK